MTTVFCRSYAFKAENPAAIKKLINPVGLKQRPVPLYGNPNTPTFADRKRDFLDPKKNRARREELKRELAESRFQPIYEFRDTGGKIFSSPPAGWPAQKALYIPNFAARSLRTLEDTELLKELPRGQPALVRVFSSDASFKQLQSYLKYVPEDFPIVDVNAPTSWLNGLLIRLFANKIKKTLTSRTSYLVGSIPRDIRSALWATNNLCGYVYVIDPDLKVRWAASGESTSAEGETLRQLISILSKKVS